MSDRVFQDKLGAHQDWKDGHDEFRANAIREIKFLRNQIALVIEQINWINNPPSKPQHIKDEENIKLWEQSKEDLEK